MYYSFLRVRRTWLCWALSSIVQKLATSGLFPPKGVNVLRFDTTPDAWGILLLEAESEADAHRAVAIWRVAGDGFLKCSRTAPVQPIQAAVAVEAELLQTLGADDPSLSLVTGEA